MCCSLACRVIPAGSRWPFEAMVVTRRGSFVPEQRHLHDMIVFFAPMSENSMNGHLTCIHR